VARLTAARDRRHAESRRPGRVAATSSPRCSPPAAVAGSSTATTYTERRPERKARDDPPCWGQVRPLVRSQAAARPGCRCARLSRFVSREDLETGAEQRADPAVDRGDRSTSERSRDGAERATHGCRPSCSEDLRLIRVQGGVHRRVRHVGGGRLERGQSHRHHRGVAHHQARHRVEHALHALLDATHDGGDARAEHVLGNAATATSMRSAFNL
jgi:hypothetical protein